MRSVETLDGHSEFLASLEHAAIVHYTSTSYFFLMLMKMVCTWNSSGKWLVQFVSNVLGMMWHIELQEI